MALADALFASPRMAAAFGDRALLDAALAFERELALAQAELGIIPQASAAAIARAAVVDGIDIEQLAHDMQRAGTLAIPLVKLLTARVAAIDPAAAGHLHLGATSQDVADTAVALVVDAGCGHIHDASQRLARALLAMADAHRSTPMLGRTLLQPGPPITFGLKAANWLLGIVEAAERMARERPQSRTLQFGGAVGNLAALGGRGIEVSEVLARRLGLALPAMPSHTRRGAIAGLGAAVGLVGLAAAKIARDVSLLMQFEVGEAAEPGGAGRGGSSTMPHKQNPIASMIALGAGARLPGLIGTLAGAIVQEHERATGGWQAELPVLGDIFTLTDAALAAVTESIDGLRVSPERMADNIQRLDGLIFAERLMLALASPLGRSAAHSHVEGLVAVAVANRKHLRDVACGDAVVARTLTRDAVAAAFDPATYLGSADAFVARAIARARQSELLAT